MCEHHHAAKHILCSQCDRLVALPRLEHGQKAACPRCGTTLTVAWDAPRQRPTAYALAALFMLLLSNLFPFVNMNVAGVTSEITLLEIPGVLFSEDYASLGTFFLLFVQLVPAFCLITSLLLVNRAELPVRLKEQLARVLFQLKTWGMAEIFLAGVLVDKVIGITNEEAISTARRLMEEEGILAGISSGAAVAAALKLQEDESFTNKNIVVILPSSGERYLSTALFADLFTEKELQQ